MPKNRLRRIGSCLLIAAGVGFAATAPHPLMSDYNEAWRLAGELRDDEAISRLKQIIAKDKAFHQAYATLAEAYWQKRDLASAEAFFKRLLIQDPGNALANYGLGEVSTRQARHDAAIEHYSACIRQRPTAYFCYEPMVKELAEARHTVSLAELKRLVPFDKPGPYAYIALATMYHIQRRLEEALDAEKRGLSLAYEASDKEAAAALEELAAGTYSAYGNRERERLLHLQAVGRLYEELDWTDKRLHVGLLLGEAFMRLGEAAEALRQFEAGAALARELKHHEWMISTEYELGRYYASQGDNETALTFYRLAEAKCDRSRTGDPLHSILQRMGDAYEALGDLRNAMKVFDELRQWSSKTQSRWDEAFALRRMGDVYRDSGEYFKAIQSLNRAIGMFREIGRSDNAGAALRVLASVHAALGNYATAIEDYGESLREARKIHDAEQQERIHLGLGELYLHMGRAPMAAVELREALRASEQTAYTHLRARTLLRLGECYSLQADFERAGAALHEGLDSARRIHSRTYEAEALIGLGNLELRRSHSARPEAYFQESLALAEPVGFAEGTLGALRGLGLSRAAQGDYPEALRYFEQAVQTIESLRARIPTPELKSDFVQENWKVYEETMDVLSRLQARQSSGGYDRQAFEYAERGRARGFLDQLTESRANINRGLSSAQQARQTSLLAGISKASGTALKEPSEKNRQVLRKAEEALAQWALDLRVTNPKYQDLQYPEPDDTAKVQSRLHGSGTVILEYALGERQSLLWAISEDHFQMATLPGRQILANEVASFRALSAHPPKGPASLDAFYERARRLYARLLSPVEGVLRGATNVVIVPDGILYYLPFEALLRPGTGHPRYLIEEYSLAYAPSATVFAKLSTRQPSSPRTARWELLAYGDPLFTTEQAPASPLRLGDLVRNSYRGGGFPFTPLPNTRVEVEAIRDLFGPDRSKIYLGPLATESSLKQEKLRDYKVVHFATHAVIDEDFPARSGVVFSLVNTGKEDGILRAAEIFELELDADLVVLSACQTGLGKLVRGEGMVGLTRAFLYAGSPRVLVSLWEVNDVATAEFMKMFYKKITQGRAPASALRDAKVAMIHSDSRAYQHPYFWSTFVLVGAL